MNLERLRAWMACLSLAVLGSMAAIAMAEVADGQRLLNTVAEPVVPAKARFPREVLEGECRDLPLSATVPLFLACIEEAARVLLPPYDPQHPEKFGLEYDPAKYLACMRASRVTITQRENRFEGRVFLDISTYNPDNCEKYRRLKPEEPEVWPTAARPVWPTLPDGRAYDPPAYDMEDKNRLHQLSRRYFDRLCKGESKAVILKTVENVDGVYIVRPNVDVLAGEEREPHLLEHMGIGHIMGSLAPFRPATAPDPSRRPNWYTWKMGNFRSTDSLILPGYEWPERKEPQGFRTRTS